MSNVLFLLPIIIICKVVIYNFSVKSRFKAMAKQLEVSVGKLSFYRENRLGLGKYSSVFKGKFEDKKTVAIKRLLKDQSRVDSHLLLNGGGHPNILPYNCIEEADVEFM